MAIQASEDSAAAFDDSQETIAIFSGGLATSSTTVRRWTRAELSSTTSSIPPRPARRLVLAHRHVVAASCVDANIASTAAIVMGPKAVSWLKAHRLAARLVDLKGGVRRVAGWPAAAANSNLVPKVL